MVNGFSRRPSKHNQNLSTKRWAKVKQYWIDRKPRIEQCQAPKCLLPGVPINYTPPFTKPDSFNCGHIVSSYEARQLGWSLDQTYSIENSRPEHMRCNIRHGAQLGNLIQRKQAESRMTDRSRW